MNWLADAVSKLPPSDTLAYREALTAASSFVHVESNPTDYLTSEQGNHVTAARRLCKYWEERKVILGERAFLPVTDISGMGALTVADIRVLRNGCAAILPQHSSASAVLAVDWSRCNRDVGDQASTRALFYQLHQIAKVPSSKTEGFYFVSRVLTEFFIGEPCDHTIKFVILSRLLSIFPIRVRAVHLVAILSLNPDADALIPFIELKLMAVQQTWERAVNIRPQLHLASTEGMAGKILEREGFLLAGVPASMGGTWSYDYDYGNWLMSQLSSSQLPAVDNQHSVPAVQLVPSQQVQPSVPSQPFASVGKKAAGDVHMRERGLDRLQEAIQFLPDEARLAYCEALARCPDLVESESDPVWFLQYEGYDVWAAARRLTTYWTWRKRIFRERAFRPMTMTGDGALNQEDIIHVRRGYFAMLPNDSEGRTVICYDPSRRVHHSKETRMRVGFYFWTVMCENEKSRLDGWVGVVLVGTSGFGSSSLDGAIRECADMVQECFPAQIKNMHLIQCLRPGERRTLLQMVLPFLNYVMGRIMENRAVTHVADTADEMLAGLAKFGISAKGLPDSAGGFWSYDSFYRWQLDRCQLERQRIRNGDEPSLDSSMARAVLVDPVTSSGIPSSGMQSVLDAIRRLPDQQKSDLMTAITKFPDLLEAESPLQRYVAYNENDMMAAGRRLAFYWSHRCFVFGDRAFLPMTQTGEGALSRTDLGAMSTGCFLILPAKRDEDTIVFYDASKHEKLSTPAIMRLAFYAFQVASESSKPAGITVIVSGLLYATKEKTPVEFSQLFEAFPLKVKTIHFTHIYRADENIGSVSLDEAVAVTRRKFGRLGDEKALVHVARTKDELYQELQCYGIRRAILPKSLGGNYGYDGFVQWQELRTRFEWGLPAGANDHDAADMYCFAHVKPLAELDAEERKERKRRLNVVHSRRKRERERIEIQVLHEQCAELKEDNLALLRDKQRLESLMEEANKLLMCGALSEDGYCNHNCNNKKRAAMPFA